MVFLAHIFRLIRVAAAFAVILSLGFSLPSAAHSLAGHHSKAVVSHAGDSHDGAAIATAGHDASHAVAQDGQDAPRNAETAKCCAGACIAVAVLSFQPQQISLTRPVRWKQKNSQLPSQEQPALLRPPRA